MTQQHAILSRFVNNKPGVLIPFDSKWIVKILYAIYDKWSQNGMVQDSLYSKKQETIETGLLGNNPGQCAFYFRRVSAAALVPA